MTHAKDGMPLCRHCQHEFTTWPAFFYHVSARSCSGLRDFFDKDGMPDVPVAEEKTRTSFSSHSTAHGKI